MTTKQKLLGVLIWVFFSVEAIRMGIWVPRVGDTALPDAMAGRNGLLALVFLGSAIFAGVFDLGLPRDQKYRAYRQFVEGMRIQWVAVVFFAGGGGLATINCIRSGAAESSLNFAMFSLSAGLGILCGLAIGKYRKSRKNL